MFRVKVGLGTMRARELPIRILGWDRGVPAGPRPGRGHGRSPWRTGQDAPPALGTYDVRRRLEGVDQSVVAE